MPAPAHLYLQTPARQHAQMASKIKVRLELTAEVLALHVVVYRAQSRVVGALVMVQIMPTWIAMEMDVWIMLVGIVMNGA